MSIKSNYAFATLTGYKYKYPFKSYFVWNIFHMTVESNYVIAIGKISDWLKYLTSVFKPIRSKAKTNHT